MNEEYIQRQFTKVISVLRKAEDYTEHDELTLRVVSKFTGLTLPSQEENKV
jgi:hypothetical protein